MHNRPRSLSYRAAGLRVRTQIVRTWRNSSSGPLQTSLLSPFAHGACGSCDVAASNTGPGRFLRGALRSRGMPLREWFPALQVHRSPTEQRLVFVASPFHLPRCNSASSSSVSSFFSPSPWLGRPSPSSMWALSTRRSTRDGP